ncbi:MAG: hypothetical protein ACLP0J_29180 [Solirubrobacteraceae bacterium]
MAHWIAHATEGGTSIPGKMKAQVLAMLEAGIWGIPTTAQMGPKLTPGDGLLILVGKPYRRFFGDAVVDSPYRAFTNDELAILPDGLSFDHGVSLRAVRIWSPSLHIDEAWSQTTAGQTTNVTGTFRQAITRVSSEDVVLIVAAGTRGCTHADGPSNQKAGSPGRGFESAPAQHHRDDRDSPESGSTTPPVDVELMSTRELLAAWAAILSELRNRDVVRTFNNPIGDIAEALVAAHYGGERGSFSQKAWDVRTATELLQVKAVRRVEPGRLGNLSPVRSDEGYDAVIGVIFTEDLRVERAIRIPRQTIIDLCPHNPHVNGRPIRLMDRLMSHPSVTAVPLSDAALDE